jgi:D-alanyl-lipoteichoic acid acyltransferase DltB (MBOAT superfamily)
MSFVSVYFFLFLAVLLPLYWVLPHKGRIGLLLVASFVFYSFFDWRLSFLLLGYILVSYFVGLGLSKIKAKGGRIALLVAGIVAELSCLFVFKYANFAFSLAHDVFRMEGEALYWRIALPLGISFFTFQTIAYMVDVYRGEIEAERNFFYYALFVSFFPQLVAGPIESANHLLPQLKQKALAKGENFTLGIQYVLRGYMKKILIADLLGVFVDATFGGALEASGWTLLLATFAFGLQIYGDFSGYSDIALGIGRLLGI